MNAVAMDSNYVYYHGFEIDPNYGIPGHKNWACTPIIEKRDKSTGALVPAFGTGGRFTYSATGMVFVPLSGGLPIVDLKFICNIVSDETYLFTSSTYYYHLGGVDYFGTKYECKNCSDGAVVWAQTYMFSVGATNTYPTGIAIDNTHMYILINEEPDYSTQKCLKVLKTDGSTVNDFSIPAHPPGRNYSQDIALDSNYIYIASIIGVSKYAKSDFTEEWFIPNLTDDDAGVYGYTDDYGYMSASCIDVDSTGVYVGFIYSIYDPDSSMMIVRFGKVRQLSLTDGSTLFETDIRQTGETTGTNVWLISLKVTSDRVVIAGWDAGTGGIRPRITSLLKYHLYSLYSHRADGDEGWSWIWLNGLQVDGYDYFSGGGDKGVGGAFSDFIFGTVKVSDDKVDTLPFIKYNPLM